MLISFICLRKNAQFSCSKQTDCFNLKEAVNNIDLPWVSVVTANQGFPADSAKKTSMSVPLVPAKMEEFAKTL